MDRKIIDFSLQLRFLVLIAVAAIIGFGIYQYNQLPVDAFPDISPIMVPVFTEAHGMAPEEVELLISYPIESKMNGLPGVRLVKSTSAAGMSVVYVYFDDDMDMYFARTLVTERLNQAIPDLPKLDEPPKLGPISTGLGQIFIYYLKADSGIDTKGMEENTYLRDLNDWVVKKQLQSVKGVTDILSIGGHVLQYQIHVDPMALRKFEVTLEDIIESVKENNHNAGGQFITQFDEEHTIRGIGRLKNLDDIKNITIKSVQGLPITINDIADVEYGNEMRRGVVSINGEREVVSGIVMQLYGANTSKVIKRLYAKIPDIQDSLPDGVHIIPYYEQAELVKNATGTVKKALVEGTILSIIVLIIFLGNFRSAFIVALSLPICALVAIICMRMAGMSANLMSLGGIAIAIGMLADGSIVMVENIFRHLNFDRDADAEHKIDIIKRASKEVSRPITFAIAIVVIVFIPIYALEGVEGIMFKPMAFTLSFALLGSLIAALIISPVLASFLLKTGSHKEFFFITWLKNLYRPLVTFALHARGLLLITLLILIGISIAVVPKLGTEFIPTLEEGSIFIGIGLAPSISLETATKTIQALEKKVVKFDGVDEVISRIGRPEAGSHPHPVNYAEIHIELKPQDEWHQYKNKQELVAALNEELSKYPGIILNFTQPIQNAFDELLSGVKAQVAIKVFGEDSEIIRKKASEIMHAVEDVPGFVDISVEQSFGQPQVQIIAKRDACARYGINAGQILELVELAIGGEVIDDLFKNTRRYGIQLRYQEKYRNDIDNLGSLLIHTENGEMIPLDQVADIVKVTGPIQINREKNQRRWTVQGNIRGTDLGSVITEIKKRIKAKIEMPSGYYIEYGGQFESQQRAMDKLSVIVPIVILTVFIMLYLAFSSLKSALLIIFTLPMGLIGGVFGLYFTGEYLSVPAAVGFIALFGIAVQDGIVMVTCINDNVKAGVPLKKAIIEGSISRLRPVLMTSFTTILGLFPLLISSGIGSEVQRPLAIVVVCGLSTATLLTLFVIPALYPWFATVKKER